MCVCMCCCQLRRSKVDICKVDLYDMCTDAFEYPVCKLSAPVRKMQNRLDSFMLALTTEGWVSVMRGSPLKSAARLADQTAKELSSCEFQC